MLCLYLFLFNFSLLCIRLLILSPILFNFFFEISAVDGILSFCFYFFSFLHHYFHHFSLFRLLSRLSTMYHIAVNPIATTATTTQHSAKKKKKVIPLTKSARHQSASLRSIEKALPFKSSPLELFFSFSIFSFRLSRDYHWSEFYFFIFSFFILCFTYSRCDIIYI